MLLSSEIRHGRHCVLQMHVHLVCITKYAKEYLTVLRSRISEWSLRRSVRSSNPLWSVWKAKTTTCIGWFTTRRSIPCPPWSTVSKVSLATCSAKSARIWLNALAKALSGRHRTWPPPVAVRRSLRSRHTGSNRRRRSRNTGGLDPRSEGREVLRPHG